VSLLTAASANSSQSAYMSRCDALLLIGSTLVFGACQETAASDAPPVSRIEIAPSSATVAAGSTTTLTAHVFGTSGEEVDAQGVFWSSQNTGVASVDQRGTVTGVAAGSVRIAASLGGQSGTASVSVTPARVALVRLRPPDGTVTIGKTLQLAADPLDNAGSVLTGRTVLWSSSATAIATVNGTGLVTGVSAGAATIHATVDGVDGGAAITVVAAPVAQVRVTPSNGSVAEGASFQLTATALDASGGTLSGRVITWATSNASIAVVSSTGAVQGMSAGTATITATCEGVRGSASITVTLVPVSSITVTPSNPTVIVGAVFQLDATLRDASGDVLNGRTVTWSSDLPTVATVSALGMVTAVTVGTATITATSGGVTGSTTVTVSPVPVASVEVSPSSVTLVARQSTQLVVTARDALGNVLSGRTSTWSSSNTAVATVSATGVVTGVSPGAVTISASVDGVTGFSTVSILPVPVASITVTPNPASVVELQTVQLTATARDANGNILSGQSIAWASANTSVATVSPTGLVSGVAAGSTTIIASAPGAGTGGTTPTTSVPLTVTYAPVASVQVSPSSATIPVGATVSFTATLFDANNRQLSPSGRTISWLSLKPSVATVNASTGVATGASAGTTTIRASASSPGQTTPATGDAALTVVAVATVTLAITPDSVIMPGSSAGVVTVLDASSKPIVGEAVTLTSSATSVATVTPASGTTDTKGQVAVTVTGVGAGTTTVTASAGGKNGSHAYRVLLPVSFVSVTPGTNSLTVGGKVTLTVTALDVNGLALAGRPCTVSSSNSAAVTVSPSSGITAGNGKFTVTATGIAKGTATITATCESKTGTATVSVA
jgi:uncharacterized protein YjdB